MGESIVPEGWSLPAAGESIELEAGVPEKWKVRMREQQLGRSSSGTWGLDEFYPEAQQLL
jgi:hypothetical protein